MDKVVIDEYRAQVATAIVAQSKTPITPDDAMKLTRDLTNEQLAEGMEWNTPEEVAQLILDNQ